MQTTKQTKILIDLKPALDGYAGIPQETRLLFYSLQGLEDYQVEGLIQHGGHVLRPALSDKTLHKKGPKQIKKLARVVISILEPEYISHVKAYFRRHYLRFATLFRIKIKLTTFDPALFQDFIWRVFFSKTLKSNAKEVITSSMYRILSPSKNQLHNLGLHFRFYTSEPPYITINTQNIDFFLVQTPFPGRVSHQTKMIVRYHDAVPILMPHVISDRKFHQESHFYALQDNIKQGAWFACISKATRHDLIKIFPEAAERSVVIYNVVSDEYYEDDSDKKMVAKIVPNRLGIAESQEKKIKYKVTCFEEDPFEFNYLLIVSTIEPRKNHLLLLDAWERLKYTTMPDLKLVIVGHLGWNCGDVVDIFFPWAGRGEVFYLNDVPSYELRILYQHATATICPSFQEGFDYSGIESMCCGTPVIASDIPVHREVYDNAAVYFNPYSVEDAAKVIEETLESTQKAKKQLNKLLKNGKIVSAQYSKKNILPQWVKFLNQLKQS